MKELIINLLETPMNVFQMKNLFIFLILYQQLLIRLLFIP